MKSIVKCNQVIRVLAGTMILLFLLLSQFHSSYWKIGIVFVALNLIQSAFTDFCLPEILLRKFKKCE